MYCPACRSEYPDGWKRCPTDEAPLLRNATVGKYKIDKLIGAGGMGAVYRAENPDTRSDVALKLLHGGSAGEEQARTRFQREAAAVAALRTRHVVSIFDFGNDVDGTLYLVMELLEGHTLRKEIGRPPDLMPIGRVHLVFDGALRGLGAAHRAGIVHRDLKPENVFIARTDDGEVAKLLDFGVARTGGSSTLTHSGALMGTPAYMAPEQIAGNRGEIGAWSDVYAMGVILYEMLAGTAPFHAESMTELLSKVLSRELAPLRSVRAGLPEAVYQLCERALADEPTVRFPDADALREAWQAAFLAFPSEVRDAPVPRFTGDAGGSDLASAPTAAATAAGTPNLERARERRGAASTNRVIAEQPSTRTPPRRGLMVIAGGVIAAIVAVAMAARHKPAARTVAALDAGRAIVDAGAPAPVVDAGSPGPLGMARLPGGSFTMGSPPDQVKLYPSALAAQATEVAAFLLDRHEVTAIELATALGRVPGPGDAPDLPARGVTWADAERACKQLGKRLPSEAEWEFAAQRGPLRDAQLLGAGVTGPAAVGSHPGDCTPDGVCDLLGNVMEWTRDGTAAARVARGASYNVSAQGRWFATIAARAAVPPDRVDPELGFRCAADAPSGTP